jgi:hypothetical protein
MNTPRLFALAIIVCLALFAAPAAWSQDETPKKDSSAAPVDTSASSIVAEYDADYDVVFKVVKAAVTELGYPENYASKKKRLIETGFRQLVEGDGFFTKMSEYGEVPYIRSPGWTVGRAKLMINFETLENGKVTVKVLGQLSGFEDRFTNIWHYWKSNGKLEQEAMDAINIAMDKERSASAPIGGAGSTSN